MDIRDFARDKHRSVDDAPFGGGPGMVMRPDVLDAAIAGAGGVGPLLLLSPRGRRLDQERVRALAGGAGGDADLRPLRRRRRARAGGARDRGGQPRRFRAVGRRAGGDRADRRLRAAAARASSAAPRRWPRRALPRGCSNTRNIRGRSCGRGGRCRRCWCRATTADPGLAAGRGGAADPRAPSRFVASAICAAQAARLRRRIERWSDEPSSADRSRAGRKARRRPAGAADFEPGDTVRVSVRVVEGERERVQAFEGVCIARKNAGINSNFTLRKISYGEGVERVFPLYSPRITAIEVVRRGVVRRAKLYYLRGRTGKAARIAERARDDRDGPKPARRAQVRSPESNRPPRRDAKHANKRSEQRMAQPRTLFDKIWDSHVIAPQGEGTYLIYIDLHLIHEVTTPQAFEGLKLAGRKVRRPDATMAVADHNIPTSNRQPASPASTSRNRSCRSTRSSATSRNSASRISRSTSLDQGIVHIIGPEQGLSQPGMTIVCGDSHTATHGAMGALAFGIGTSEVEHVLATQTLIQAPAKNMLIEVNGALGAGVSPKDVILAIIAKIGTAGGTGHVFEYAGSTFRDMSMEGRMTVCNMSIEAGARAGLVAPDEKTIAYVDGPALRAEGRRLGAGGRLLAHPAVRPRRQIRQGGASRRRRHRAARHLGHQPGTGRAGHRPGARPGSDRRSAASGRRWSARCNTCS